MVQKNVANILKDHVTLELEGIDRMYLNGYVPSLQTGGGFAYFVREQLGYPIASMAMIAPMSRAFVERIEAFVAESGLDLVRSRKGERKDDVAKAYLRDFEGDEGVLFVGKAQEKASVFRTEQRTNEAGVKYPWIIRSTAMVNHYYFYVVDRFIKGQKYTLLSNRENLSLEGKKALKALLAANKRLNTAYLLKESFGQLWDYQREGWARRFFENWRAALKWQRLEPYQKFAEMIDRHWDGIAVYCHPENKVSLGFVEGLNNKIRVLQRRAYGLRDEEYLRLKILTCMLPPL